MPARLSSKPFVPSLEPRGRGGSSGCHIPRVLFVARRVGNDEFALCRGSTGKATSIVIPCSALARKPSSGVKSRGSADRLIRLSFYGASWSS